jgi:hypothetical protein
MKVFGTQWERIRGALTPTTLRFAAAIVTLGLVAVIGHSPVPMGEHWT